MKTLMRGLIAAGLVGAFVSVPTMARAQGVEGRTEVVAFAGGVTDGGGLALGGGVQRGLRPRVLLAVEAAYLTGSDASGFGVSVDSHAIAVDANVHYLFPVASNPKLTPYVLGGLGYIRFSASASAGGFSSGGSASDVGLNIGGGLRWQGGENWGVRPELKLFVADGSHARVSVGFYRSF